MRPIFKPGDLLEVLPYEDRQVRCGDVILFSCPSENCKVVHRVADLDARGIRTKGDNNARIDSWVVTPQQVVGYVIRAQRGRRWRRISGGYVGRLAANCTRAVKRVREWTTRTGLLGMLRRGLAAMNVITVRSPGSLASSRISRTGSGAVSRTLRASHAARGLAADHVHRPRGKAAN
jgi:signal peptidase I